jgi:hypothetical protein
VRQFSGYRRRAIPMIHVDLMPLLSQAACQ